MFHRDPILIKAPMGRIYAFTRYYRGNNIFDGPHLAFPHDRGFARERLLDLTRHIGDDPFNDRLHDVWQMVFQKPWTRPKSLHELVMDLTDKITRGELFVYEERDPDRSHRIPVSDGPPEGGAEFVDNACSQADKPPMDRPRVSGPPVSTSASWGSDYADGLSDTASAMASDIASEQAELYENTSGWGNVMYPIFKPVENAGRFVGNTVGLLSGLSPNGMKPEVAQYWKDMGEGFQALGDRVVDAVGGDGRAAGEITPAVASILVSKKVPNVSLLRQRQGSLRGDPEMPHPNASVDMARSLMRQNESAELLADRGLNVTHLPNIGRKGGNPDLEINGRPADVYSPKSKNPNTIWDNMTHKVDHQAPDIVLNLTDSPLGTEDMVNFLNERPVVGLEDLYIIDGEQVTLVRK